MATGRKKQKNPLPKIVQLQIRARETEKLRIMAQAKLATALRAEVAAKKSLRDHEKMVRGY